MRVGKKPTLPLLYSKPWHRLKMTREHLYQNSFSRPCHFLFKFYSLTIQNDNITACLLNISWVWDSTWNVNKVTSHFILYDKHYHYQASRESCSHLTRVVQHAWMKTQARGQKWFYWNIWTLRLQFWVQCSVLFYEIWNLSPKDRTSSPKRCFISMYWDQNPHGINKVRPSLSSKLKQVAISHLSSSPLHSLGHCDYHVPGHPSLLAQHQRISKTERTKHGALNF